MPVSAGRRRQTRASQPDVVVRSRSPTGTAPVQPDRGQAHGHPEQLCHERGPARWNVGEDATARRLAERGTQRRLSRGLWSVDGLPGQMPGEAHWSGARSILLLCDMSGTRLPPPPAPGCVSSCRLIGVSLLVGRVVHVSRSLCLGIAHFCSRLGSVARIHTHYCPRRHLRPLQHEEIHDVETRKPFTCPKGLVSFDHCRISSPLSCHGAGKAHDQSGWR